MQLRLRRLQLPEQAARAKSDATAVIARAKIMHTVVKQVHLDTTVAADLRCDCGKLLARVVRTVLELKCPRCKRAVLVVGGRRFKEVGAQSCACQEDLTA